MYLGTLNQRILHREDISEYEGTSLTPTHSSAENTDGK